MTIDDFLEARLKEDTSLPVDDVLTKHHIVGIYRILGSDDSGDLDKDAWIITREIVRLLCLRYANHPDYNPAWKPTLANCITTPRRIVLGADQPEVGPCTR
ncbi:DUF6221 family protein [Streptomyces griseoflavus]|uniref:DUF6221 family protein n=1 Tax=Streptomyces griseoflavus TaxID=35619 RepID=UPI003819DD34